MEKRDPSGRFSECASLSSKGWQLMEDMCILNSNADVTNVSMRFLPIEQAQHKKEHNPVRSQNTSTQVTFFLF